MVLDTTCAFSKTAEIALVLGESHHHIDLHPMWVKLDGNSRVLYKRSHLRAKKKKTARCFHQKQAEEKKFWTMDDNYRKVTVVRLPWCVDEGNGGTVLRIIFPQQPPPSSATESLTTGYWITPIGLTLHTRPDPPLREARWEAKGCNAPTLPLVAQTYPNMLGQKRDKTQKKPQIKRTTK